MKITKNGFTLVELVVVVVIIAILATIGLLSFRGYSADARNAKRSQDIDNLKNRFTSQITNGANLLGFVSGSVTDNRVAEGTINLQGSGTLRNDPVESPSAFNYDAGEINYETLGVNAADFLDPESTTSNQIKYRAGVTSLLSGKFQIAASMENGSSRSPIVAGTWYGRAGTVSNLFTLSAATTTAAFTLSSPKDAYKLAVGDTITYRDNGSSTNRNNTTITSISSNGLTFTTALAPTATADRVFLTLTEGAGLIDNGKGGAGIVLNGVSTNLPY